MTKQTENAVNVELETRRELLVQAYQEIKDGAERGIILAYQTINSKLDNVKFFERLHKMLKSGDAKGQLFTLCKAKNIHLYPPKE